MLITENLLGVIIGGLVASIAPVIILYYESSRWRRDRLLEQLRLRRSYLETEYAAIIAELKNGIRDRSFSIDLLTKSLVLMPDSVAKSIDALVAEQDYSVGVLRGHFENIHVSMKISIRKIDEDISRLLGDNCGMADLKRIDAKRCNMSKNILCISIGIVFGLILGYLLPQYGIWNKYDKWMDISEKDISVEYTLQKGAVLDIDGRVIKGKIPEVGIGRMRFKAKFMKPEKSNAEHVAFGYVGDVEFAPIDRRAIPSKYASLKIIGAGYRAILCFDVFDKDGFKLAEITSPEVYINIEKPLKIQNLIYSQMQNGLVRQVKSVKLRIKFVEFDGYSSPERAFLLPID